MVSGLASTSWRLSKPNSRSQSSKEKGPHRASDHSPSPDGGPDRPTRLDETQPRLSWRPQDDRRGARQSPAYRVLVASSLEQLSVDQGDLWDSGAGGIGRDRPYRVSGVSLRAFSRAAWKGRAGGMVTGLLRRRAKRRQLRARAADERRLSASRPRRGREGREFDETARRSSQHPTVGDPKTSRSAARMCAGLSSSKTRFSRRAYITALGLYQASINSVRDGRRQAGSDGLSPPRFPYQAYDVTDLLRPGGQYAGRHPR